MTTHKLLNRYSYFQNLCHLTDLNRLLQLKKLCRLSGRRLRRLRQREHRHVGVLGRRHPTDDHLLSQQDGSTTTRQRRRANVVWRTSEKNGRALS